MMLSALVKKPAPTLMFLLRPCLRHYSTAPGPNEELIQALSRYMEEEKASASSNSYKVRAYSKAIDAIGQLPSKVRSIEQVRHLSGIGVRIAKRIDAYLSGVPYEPPTPKRSRKAEKSKTLDGLRRDQAVSSLSTINGLGSSKANALYDAGCKSLQDLIKPEFLKMLSRSQRINAQYMIAKDRPMACEQAFTVRDFVSQNVLSKFTVLLSGDLRRGAASAQHITLVVPHSQPASLLPPEAPPNVDSTIKQKSKSTTIPLLFASDPQTKANLTDTTMWKEIILPLEFQGLVATTITTSSQRWTGVIRIPERAENGWETREERVQGVQNRQGQFFSAEIYCVPLKCAGATLIALTGDNQFNIAVRKAASRLGYHLNEYGLWMWQESGMTTSVDATDKQKQSDIMLHGGYWELVASETEEEILQAVGMEWVVPERRNFANLVGRPRKRKTEE